MLKQNIILPDLLSKKEIESIMTIDARLVARHNELCAYKAENADKYSVICNTWLYMCAQYISRRNVLALMDMMRRDGLLAVIDRCSRLASEIIRSNFSLDDLGDLRFLMTEDARITLQLLRYPKRFSPSCAGLLQDEGLKAFERLNFSLRGVPTVINPQGKVLERSIEYPRWLADRVAYWCANCLAFKPITDDIPLMMGRFSNGVSANGSKTMYAKYVEWSKLTPGYKDALLYPLPRFGNHDQGELPDINYVKAVAVPKSYKAPRIIAEVSAKCQYHQQGIREYAIACLNQCWAGDYILLDDQTINQEWSRLGSIYGTYATIDLSSASDSISDHLAKRILPKDWYTVISRHNPDFIRIGNKEVKRNIFLTSGSGDTFVLESVIFMAIAMTALEYVECLTNEKLLLPRVYGDDLICDTRCFDTLVDFLGMLGFTVNVDKSFNNGDYRESCGAEWFCGLDTATKYFPRRAFDEKSSEYLEGLIALQHRVYEFEMCEQWLTNHIRNLYRTRTGKELTSSAPGVECEDLWSDYPYYYTVYPPYDHTSPTAEATRKWLDDHNIRRECHSATARKRLTGKAFDRAFLEEYHRLYTWEQIHMMEMFRYVDFLQHGTPVDEWGVPIHRQDVVDDLLISEIIWTTHKR